MSENGPPWRGAFATTRVPLVSLVWVGVVVIVSGIIVLLPVISKGVSYMSKRGDRDRLIHHYFGVNLDIVWAIVKDELKELLPRIKEIISSK